MTEYHNCTAAPIINKIIQSIVSEGHPKARRLAEDYNEARERLLTDNPKMTIGIATIETLMELLRQAYGIFYLPSIAENLEVLDRDILEKDALAILQAAEDIRNGRLVVA